MKTKLRIQTLKLVAAIIRDTRGIFLYANADKNKFNKKIKKANKIGRNIVIVTPSLCSPHGNWLKIGIKGGRLL